MDSDRLCQMDAFTSEHLNNWIDRQFDHLDSLSRGSIWEAMRETYATDPEFYGRSSWWTCYDNCDAAKRIMNSAT